MVNNEFLVSTPSTTRTQLSPALLGLSDGSFLIGWSDFFSLLRFQHYAADNTPLGSPLSLNTFIDGNICASLRLTSLGDNRFVATWLRYNSSTNIWARLLEVNTPQCFQRPYQPLHQPLSQPPL